MGTEPEKIRKVVIPAAGMGTRFLPASKSVPKEMLCLVDKPIIQYIVEEAVEAGIEQVILVTSSGKFEIEDHFDVSYELEDALRKKGKTELLDYCERLHEMAEVISVRQHVPKGLGHAIWCAKPVVGNEPFLVMLPDDIVDNPGYSCARQLIDVYQKYQAPVVAIMEVPDHMISLYGIVKHEQVDENIYRIWDMIEKPRPEDAPSNLGIVTMYLFTPDIFDAIEKTEPGHAGEIQITDAIRNLAGKGPVYGCKFQGQRFDAGDKLGYLEATIHFALKHPELGQRFKALIRKKAEEIG
jgi:UTP--glucose-1-phosphate uridylyltransferase